MAGPRQLADALNAFVVDYSTSKEDGRRLDEMQYLHQDRFQRAKNELDEIKEEEFDPSSIIYDESWAMNRQGVPKQERFLHIPDSAKINMANVLVELIETGQIPTDATQAELTAAAELALQTKDFQGTRPDKRAITGSRSPIAGNTRQAKIAQALWEVYAVGVGSGIDPFNLVQAIKYNKADLSRLTNLAAKPALAALGGRGLTEKRKQVALTVIDFGVDDDHNSSIASAIAQRIPQFIPIGTSREALLAAFRTVRSDLRYPGVAAAPAPADILDPVVRAAWDIAKEAGADNYAAAPPLLPAQDPTDLALSYAITLALKVDCEDKRLRKKFGLEDTSVKRNKKAFSKLGALPAAVRQPTANVISAAIPKWVPIGTTSDALRNALRTVRLRADYAPGVALPADIRDPLLQAAWDIASTAQAPQLPQPPLPGPDLTAAGDDDYDTAIITATRSALKVKTSPFNAVLEKLDPLEAKLTSVGMPDVTRPPQPGMTDYRFLAPIAAQRDEQRAKMKDGLQQLESSLLKAPPPPSQNFVNSVAARVEAIPADFKKINKQLLDTKDAYDILEPIMPEAGLDNNTRNQKQIAALAVIAARSFPNLEPKRGDEGQKLQAIVAASAAQALATQITLPPPAWAGGLPVPPAVATPSYTDLLKFALTPPGGPPVTSIPSELLSKLAEIDAAAVSEAKQRAHNQGHDANPAEMKIAGETAVKNAIMKIAQQAIAAPGARLTQQQAAIDTANHNATKQAALDAARAATTTSAAQALSAPITLPPPAWAGALPIPPAVPAAPSYADLLKFALTPPGSPLVTSIPPQLLSKLEEINAAAVSEAKQRAHNQGHDANPAFQIEIKNAGETAVKNAILQIAQQAIAAPGARLTQQQAAIDTANHNATKQAALDAARAATPALNVPYAAPRTIGSVILEAYSPPNRKPQADPTGVLARADAATDALVGDIATSFADALPESIAEHKSSQKRQLHKSLDQWTFTKPLFSFDSSAGQTGLPPDGAKITKRFGPDNKYSGDFEVHIMTPGRPTKVASISPPTEDGLVDKLFAAFYLHKAGKPVTPETITEQIRNEQYARAETHVLLTISRPENATFPFELDEMGDPRRLTQYLKLFEHANGLSSPPPSDNLDSKADPNAPRTECADKEFKVSPALLKAYMDHPKVTDDEKVWVQKRLKRINDTVKASLDAKKANQSPTAGGQAHQTFEDKIKQAEILHQRDIERAVNAAQAAHRAAIDLAFRTTPAGGETPKERLDRINLAINNANAHFIAAINGDAAHAQRHQAVLNAALEHKIPAGSPLIASAQAQADRNKEALIAKVILHADLSKADAEREHVLSSQRDIANNSYIFAAGNAAIGAFQNEMKRIQDEYEGHIRGEIIENEKERATRIKNFKESAAYKDSKEPHRSELLAKELVSAQRQFDSKLEGIKVKADGWLKTQIPLAEQKFADAVKLELKRGDDALPKLRGTQLQQALTASDHEYARLVDRAKQTAENKGVPPAYVDAAIHNARTDAQAKGQATFAQARDNPPDVPPPPADVKPMEDYEKEARQQVQKAGQQAMRVALLDLTTEAEKERAKKVNAKIAEAKDEYKKELSEGRPVTEAIEEFKTALADLKQAHEEKITELMAEAERKRKGFAELKAEGVVSDAEQELKIANAALKIETELLKEINQARLDLLHDAQEKEKQFNTAIADATAAARLKEEKSIRESAISAEMDYLPIVQKIDDQFPDDAKHHPADVMSKDQFRAQVKASGNKTSDQLRTANVVRDYKGGETQASVLSRAKDPDLDTVLKFATKASKIEVDDINRALEATGAALAELTKQITETTDEQRLAQAKVQYEKTSIDEVQTLNNVLSTADDAYTNLRQAVEALGAAAAPGDEKKAAPMSPQEIVSAREKNKAADTALQQAQAELLKHQAAIDTYRDKMIAAMETFDSRFKGVAESKSVISAREAYIENFNKQIIQLQTELENAENFISTQIDIITANTDKINEAESAAEALEKEKLEQAGQQYDDECKIATDELNDKFDASRIAYTALAEAATTLGAEKKAAPPMSAQNKLVSDKKEHASAVAALSTAEAVIKVHQRAFQTYAELMSNAIDTFDSDLEALSQTDTVTQCAKDTHEHHDEQIELNKQKLINAEKLIDDYREKIRENEKRIARDEAALAQSADRERIDAINSAIKQADDKYKADLSSGITRAESKYESSLRSAKRIYDEACEAASRKEQKAAVPETKAAHLPSAHEAHKAAIAKHNSAIEKKEAQSEFQSALKEYQAAIKAAAQEFDSDMASVVEKAEVQADDRTSFINAARDIEEAKWADKANGISDPVHAQIVVPAPDTSPIHEAQNRVSSKTSNLLSSVDAGLEHAEGTLREIDESIKSADDEVRRTAQLVEQTEREAEQKRIAAEKAAQKAAKLKADAEEAERQRLAKEKLEQDAREREERAREQAKLDAKAKEQDAKRKAEEQERKHAERQAKAKAAQEAEEKALEQYNSKFFKANEDWKTGFTDKAAEATTLADSVLTTGDAKACLEAVTKLQEIQTALGKAVDDYKQAMDAALKDVKSELTHTPENISTHYTKNLQSCRTELIREQLSIDVNIDKLRAKASKLTAEAEHLKFSQEFDAKVAQTHSDVSAFAKGSGSVSAAPGDSRPKPIVHQNTLGAILATPRPPVTGPQAQPTRTIGDTAAASHASHVERKGKVIENPSGSLMAQAHQASASRSASPTPSHSGSHPTEHKNRAQSESGSQTHSESAAPARVSESPSPATVSNPAPGTPVTRTAINSLSSLTHAAQAPAAPPASAAAPAPAAVGQDSVNAIDSIGSKIAAEFAPAPHTPHEDKGAGKDKDPTPPSGIPSLRRGSTDT